MKRLVVTSRFIWIYNDLQLFMGRMQIYKEYPILPYYERAFFEYMDVHTAEHCLIYIFIRTRHRIVVWYFAKTLDVRMSVLKTPAW